MAQVQLNERAQSIIERGKEAVAEGNQRHIVLSKQDGSQLFETSLTTAAAVGFVLLITGILSWPVILIAAIAFYATKAKVELRHDS